MSQHAERPHVAEDVLPGHPDRVCDAIAERIVDGAVAVDERALVGVEVALFRETVVVTGRIAASRGGPCGTGVPPTFREGVINEAFEAAGYEGPWAVSGLPRDASRGENMLRLLMDLEIGELSCEESGIRGFSDDQNIVVGHASGSEATGWLPPGPFVARRLREALGRVREGHPDRLGPDGKVLVRFLEDDGKFAWDVCNVAIQHAEGAGYDELHHLVVPALREAAGEVDSAVPGLGASFRLEAVRLNGGGDFSCGGPRGDNGLSGKKLVVDHYGPGVPIGGGALCGKDPHKVDRAGALRARQLAVRLVRDAGARRATVRLGFLPGLEAPAWMDAFVGGEWWDADRIAGAVAVPDLSLEGTFRELELASVRWSEAVRAGYFGNEAAWER